MLGKLLPYIETHEPVPSKLMLAIIHQIEESISGEKWRAAANEILPEAGDYLPGNKYLDSFIRAELSHEEAYVKIDERKQYLERLRFLVPSILDLIGAHNERDIGIALSIINDACVDFPIVKASRHAKIIRRDTLQGVKEIKLSAQHLVKLMDDIGWQVDIEYDQHKEALTKSDKQRVKPLAWFNELKRDLKYLIFSVDLAVHKDETGEHSFFISDNREKTHIVEYSYYLILSRGKPRFVTTPGSDFSTLCSLLYELASGEQDQSLAGAINKFARSKQKEKIDSDEADFQRENSSEYLINYESDNFFYQKEELTKLFNEYSYWGKMLQSRAGDEDAETQIMKRAINVAEQILEMKSKVGPFQIWTSQISHDDLNSHDQVMKEHDLKRLTQAIEIGKLKRQN